MQSLGCAKLTPQSNIESQKELTNPNKIPRTFLSAPQMEFRMMLWKGFTFSHALSFRQKFKNQPVQIKSKQ